MLIVDLAILDYMKYFFLKKKSSQHGVCNLPKTEEVKLLNSLYYFTLFIFIIVIECLFFCDFQKNQPKGKVIIKSLIL